MDRLLKYIIGILLILLFSCSVYAEKNRVGKNGIIDLRDWTANEKVEIALSGEWEFYWMQLIEPNEFDTLTQKPHFVEMPLLFHQITLDGEPLPAFGYATYRLRILCPKNKQRRQYALYYKRLFSAANVWVNGELVAKEGVVGTTRDREKALLRTNIHHFPCSDTIEVVLQISNFHHRKGGFMNSPKFGLSASLQQNRLHLVGLDSFLLGVLIIISFYQFGIYIYRRKAFAALNFALFGFSVATYLAFNNEIVITQIWPSIPFELFQLANFSSTILRLYFWVVFLSIIFPDEIKPWFVKWVGYPTLLLQLLVLFTPAYIYTFALPIIIVLSGGSMVYLIIGIVRAVLNRRDGARHTLVGTSAMFITATNDILYETMVIKTTFLLPFGVLVFFIMQSFMLAMHFSRSFNEIEDLSIKLRLVNENLESDVEIRTHEIELQKQELEAHRDEIKRQSEHLEQQNNLLRHKQSEMHDSIIYAKNIQRAVLPPEDVFANAFSDHFILYRPKDIVSGDFYWFKEFRKSGETFYVFAAADCTGHGVPGAFLSMLGISLLNEIVPNRKFTEANEILEEMRKELKMALRQTTGFRKRKDGIDMSVCVINPAQMHMQFAGAYSNLFLIRNTELLEYKGTPAPIGVHPIERSFVKHEIALKENDSIYLHSDGYTDQLGGSQNTKFLRKNFKTLLYEIRNEDMATQRNLLNNKLDEWAGETPQVDDVLVLGLRI